MALSEQLKDRPFARVAASLKKAIAEEEERKQAAAQAAAAAAAAAAARVQPPPPSEEDLFQEEMRGVQRLDPSDQLPPRVRRRAVVPRDEEAEVMAQLADLVSGRASFDFGGSDEHIEGIGQGLDRRLLKKLRQGFFAVQAHLDLHGKTRAEAHELVDAFIATSRTHGRRCVLIVHGRGRNSKDQIPVLKESLKVWLARGRIARSVLAFCSARPSDGGYGAVYVLLRR
jgi:DNA-nicking Smr family endonuclease